MQTHSQTQTRRQSKQVSDEGGGIKREQMGRVFAFLYTTARDNSNTFDDVEDFGTQSPMAGLGYGLPVARLYARYSTGSLIGYSIGYSRIARGSTGTQVPLSSCCTHEG